MEKEEHKLGAVLQVKGGNAFHQNGETIRLANRIVNIGETADCDVRYEAGGQAPVYYASIVRADDGQGWRIVSRSQYADIIILGKGSAGFGKQLADGDIIQFGEQPMRLCFQTVSQPLHAQRPTHNILIMAALLALTAIAVAAALALNRNADISEQDVLPLEEAICLVQVDSVCQVLATDSAEVNVKPAKVLAGEAPTGTAFLTTDGRLVTARHCVEYWLGSNLDLTRKFAALPEDCIERWAIETETFNQEHDADSTMLLRVFFSVYNFLGEKKFSFASTDRRVHMPKERDGIFVLADFSHEYYWRSIRPYFANRRMALDDILWIDSVAETGKVQLATTEQMKAARRGTRLMVCGYPMTGTGDRQVMFASGTIKRDWPGGEENLFFESNINHGFSGGPVLMRQGGRIVAVGVVSCVDSVSSGLFKWAVPVTEATNGGGHTDE